MPLRILLLTASVLSASGAVASDRPLAVTSLKPLELLVRAVGGDQLDVSTLVPAGSSPHTYQLRPSERRELASADVVFWVGPGMENFLTRLLTGPDFSDRTIALAPSGEMEDEHEHEHEHEEHGQHEEQDEHEEASGHHGHDHGEGNDPHIWLDPALALAMSETIATQIKQLDGVDASVIDSNLNKFSRELTATEEAIRQQLEPARELDLFTYHDAFRRFAEHYGLSIAGVLTLSPERTPGAKHLAKVQDSLARADRPCLLTEPQFDRQWWDSLMSDTNVPLSTWDPLASDIDATPEGYLKFQQGLADAVLHCLPEHTQQ